MRKLFILVSLILLVGCSSNNEINSFTEKYNENAYEFVSVELLNKDEFGELRKEKYGSWKTLQQFKDRYTIEAKYDDGNLTGYYISISGDQPYEDYEGEGYEASQIIVETLGLDRAKFEEAFKSTVAGSEDTTYTDNEYEISLSEFSIVQSNPHDGIIINFDKN